MSYLIKDIKSTLIKEIEYDVETRELRIMFRKYFVDELIYVNVPFNYFEEFSNPIGKSHGQFYLQMIKPKFTIKTNAMADEKKKIETANYELGTEKRYLRCSIDVSKDGKLNRDLLVQHESGKVFLHFTVQIQPEGKVDKYGNLGMITQDVPNDIYQKEKHLAADKRTQGEILGNACEFKRKPKAAAGDTTGATSFASMNEDEKDKFADDLPF